MKLPSKKIIALIIVCVSAVVFAFSYQKYSNRTVAGSIKQADLVQVAGEKDSDTDGVSDWQEVLWGLDPQNAVSNTDKIPDSEYLNKKKEELAKNPSQIKNKFDTTGSNAGTTSNLSPTEKLDIETFSEYTSLKQSGVLTTPNINITTEGIANNNSYTFENSYKISDIKTIPDSDLGGVKLYGNEFAALRSKYVNQYQKNTLTSDIFNQDNVSGNNFQNKINSISNIYLSLSNELSILKVPSSLAQTHLKLINNYAKSASAFKILSNLSEDPLSAAYALNEHSIAESEEPQLLSQIRLFFQSNGIIFLSDETGIFWSQ